MIKLFHHTGKERKARLSNIELNNICYRFKSSLSINNVNFSENKLNIIKGKNASGKTNLLKVIAGHIIPKSGEIQFSDDLKVDFNRFKLKDQKRFTEYVKNNISFIESPNFLYNEASIEQNLNYYLKINKEKEILEKQKKFIDFLNYFKVEEDKNKTVSSLSKGTRQKLIIIFQILLDRKIILMDEPTLGFDKESVAKFFNMFEELDKTFIITTHEENFIQRPNFHNFNMEDIQR